MLPRLPVMLGLAFLVGFPALGGCSSSRRRDQNFGTDEGANYQIPDAASFSSQAAEDADTAEAETGSEAPPADASAQESDSGIDS